MKVYVLVDVLGSMSQLDLYGIYSTKEKAEAKKQEIIARFPEACMEILEEIVE